MRDDKCLAHRRRIVSPEWLSEQLTRNGHLLSGHVVAVQERPAKMGVSTFLSEFFELDMTYSEDSDTAPKRCLMKASVPGHFNAGRKEATFYEAVSQLGVPGLLKCYATSVDSAAESAIVLLEDKRNHNLVQTQWPVPPPLEWCERVVQSLARVHAIWWESSLLDNPDFAREDEGSIATVFTQLRRAYETFQNAHGHTLSVERARILERLLDRYPKLLGDRHKALPNQTLLHGDSHLWNFLIPQDAEDSPILIDWQDWRVGQGAADLAYMMALHWFTERRQRLEAGLLQHYLSELNAQGVRYDMGDLQYDYRLQVALLPLVPIIQSAVGTPAMIWWPHLDRAFAAFDDLSCGELLD